MTMKTSYRTCPLCEATCGLEIVTHDDEVVSIRGDAQDVFSQGYICPKAYSLKELHEDPDRIRTPMVRRGEHWYAVSWDEAFREVEHGLMPIIQQQGRDALAVYIGNPNVHNLSSPLYLPALLQAAGTRNVYSASTVDQMPKQVSCGLMFGTGLSTPIPDVDRTEYLLILGANPLVSNGSLMTAPDMRDRLRRLRQRGGKIVVLDPYRTRTAQEASEHHFIRPGCDAYFLFALVHVLFVEGLVAPGRLEEHLNGLEEVRALAQEFPPERVAERCGIDAETIRRLARELAAAPKAVVYARIGTCTQAFGTLTSWLVDVLNVLTGNLDREGGAMFPKAAAGAHNANGTPGKGRGVRFGRWKSRVRGLPEFFGELPALCLAEEIETPGQGQIRALITVAGNPALSTPNGARLQKALEMLDFMVSVDVYLNETTRYANVILPPPSLLTRSHYDLAFYQLSVHNVAHYSPPVLEHRADQPDEWKILLRLAGILLGQGSQANVDMLDSMTVTTLIQRDVRLEGSRVYGRDVNEILEALEPQRGPERILDYLLRSGPYGDGFSQQQGGLSLSVLKASPHGVDLGPLQPRIPEVLRTPSGKIELAPPHIIADVARLHAILSSPVSSDTMLLIGRRDLRSNNSWMHNLHVLTKGKNRCTLHIHPDDAARAGLHQDDLVSVTSRVGSIEIAIEITNTIMPGVVSIPHGWGHNLPGMRLHIATEHAGVSANLLTDEGAFDPLSGNAALNGIAVTLQRVAVPVA
jgi:anaerobic selenocysteine-containing dehydrogenase